MDMNIKSKKFCLDDLLSVGWRIYRANIKTILLIILLVYVPVVLITVLVPQKTIFASVANLLLSCIEILVLASVAFIVEKAIHGENILWTEVLKLAFAKWGEILVTGFIAGLLILVLSLLFIIPGIIFWQYYIFVPYVVALRDKTGGEALKYSKSLVEGQWWNIFTIVFVLDLMQVPFSLGIVFLLRFISTNPYILVISIPLVEIIGSFFIVTYVLLFLNNDYLKHARPAENMVPIESL